ADLYYRLNVFPIRLPPLRERGDDVILLAEHFLAVLNAEEKTQKTLGASARERIRRHSWPGNVRELRNVVHRAYIMATDVVELDPPPVGPNLPSPATGPAEGAGVEGPLDDIERRAILARLEKCGGDKRATAASLGISLKTLYNRLNAYGARENRS